MKSFIDMTRPMALYLGTLGFLLVASLVLSNVPELAFSSFVAVPHHRKLSAGLFLTGALLLALTFWLHASRAANPWRISRAQVTLPYVLAASLLSAAVVLSR